MQVHTDLDKIPQFRNAVVTIGTFDGVHVGHQQVISCLREEAAKLGGETVIISFHPHPREVVGNEEPVRMITTVGERIALLAAQGVNHLILVPFNRPFSELSPEAYVEKFLIGLVRPALVIIGYDHKFGRDRKGDYALLENYSRQGHFRLMEIPRQLINDIAVSSTEVRSAIQAGQIEKARLLLGYSYFFEGVVVKGDRRGRELGFPTANLLVNPPEKLLPGKGVYAVRVLVGDAQEAEPDMLLPKGPERPGMMNIGWRPTIGGNARTVEVHLFDFDEDIYGKKLRVTPKAFLRGEQRFPDLQALARQLALDREQAIHLLSAG